MSRWWGWRMVFIVLIPEILVARLPVDDELDLFCSVLYPIKSHINCFGAFLFDCAIGKTYCSGVVNLHWGGWLEMSHFLQGCVNWDCFLPVGVRGTYFCFCSLAHHVAEYFCDYMGGTIECAFGGIRGMQGQENISAGATSSLWVG